MAELSNIDSTDNNDNQTVVLVNKNTSTETGVSANPVRIDPTGTTTQPVSGTISVGTITGTGSFNSKVRAEATLTSVNLPAATYTVVYTYTGTGYFIGFNHEYNNTNIIVRLKIDGEVIFDTFTLGNYNGLLATANNSSRYQAGHGIITSSSSIDFSFKVPIKFATSVEIAANANSGLLARSFTQGIVYIEKDT